MSSLDIAATMDDLAEACVTAGIVKNGYGWPVGSVTVPCVLVGFPTDPEYDVTFGNALMRTTFPVFLLAGPKDAKSSRDFLSAAILPMKAALDGSAGDTARAQIASFAPVSISDVEYAAARFDVEVYA